MEAHRVFGFDEVEVELRLALEIARGRELFVGLTGGFRRLDFADEFHERIHGQIRGEVINALNQVQFNNPGTSPSNASFGLISASSQLNPPRTVQLGFKVSF